MAKLETWRKTGLCIMTGDLRSQALGSGSRENKNTLKQGQSFAKWLENFDLELSALSLMMSLNTGQIYHQRDRGKVEGKSSIANW